MSWPKGIISTRHVQLIGTAIVNGSKRARHKGSNILLRPYLIFAVTVLLQTILYHVTQQKLQATFESQKEEEKFTTAELEEMAVRKRRAEGTPCTLENFLEWRNRFYQEMAAIKADETQEDGNTGKVKKKDKVKQVDKSGRITGYEHFSSKANIEALEAAAEMAEQDDTALVDEDDDEDIDNENLFDDDVDLDDLDFDDEDDEEEEVDI